MRQVIRQMFLFLIIMAAALSSSCAYMQKRGNDARQIFDIGITVSPKLEPDFAVYVGFLGAIPIGGAYMEDVKFFGIGNNQAGMLDYENKSWGALVWGSSKQGAGEFDANDPYQARDDQRNLTERPRFNTGPLRIMAEDNPPPPLGFAVCDKAVHLGYVGIVFNCRIVELFDFLVGWTTLDIRRDDNLGTGGGR